MATSMPSCKPRSAAYHVGLLIFSRLFSTKFRTSRGAFLESCFVVLLFCLRRRQFATEGDKILWWPLSFEEWVVSFAPYPFALPFISLFLLSLCHLFKLKGETKVRNFTNLASLAGVDNTRWKNVLRAPRRTRFVWMWHLYAEAILRGSSALPFPKGILLQDFHL